MSTAVPSGSLPNPAFVTAPCAAATAVMLIRKITPANRFAIPRPNLMYVRSSVLRIAAPGAFRLTNGTPGTATIRDENRDQGVGIRDQQAQGRRGMESS